MSIYYQDANSGVRRRLDKQSQLYLSGASTSPTNAIKHLYALDTVLECSCNPLRAQMHLRKKVAGFSLVNSAENGIHAIDCPHFSKVKALQGWREKLSAKPEHIVSLILSTKTFKRFAVYEGKLRKPIYKQWNNVINRIESELPNLFGLVRADGYRTENVVQLHVTKDKARIPGNAEIIGKSKFVSSGPWLVFSFGRKGPSFVVPILSFTTPMPISFESDRYAISKSIKATALGCTNISSGLYPMELQGKQVHAAYFIHGKSLEAVLLADDSNKETVERIKRSMEGWGIASLTVRIFEAGNEREGPKDVS